MPAGTITRAESPRVFISYARSDGEKFATDLRQRLLAEHIPLWQDRVGMEGGKTGGSRLPKRWTRRIHGTGHDACRHAIGDGTQRVEVCAAAGGVRLSSQG